MNKKYTYSSRKISIVIVSCIALWNNDVKKSIFTTTKRSFKDQLH
jgi:hypothetical protein